MPNRNAVTVIIAIALLCILTLVAYNLPPIHNRLSPRLESLSASIQYRLNPPDEAVFIPQEQVAPIDQRGRVGIPECVVEDRRGPPPEAVFLRQREGRRPHIHQLRHPLRVLPPPRRADGPGGQPVVAGGREDDGVKRVRAICGVAGSHARHAAARQVRATC